MKKLLFALFAVLAVLTSCKKVNLSHGDADGVGTLGAENITLHTAKLNGRLTILDPQPKEVGFIYDRKGHLKPASSPRVDCGTGAEYFWATIENLDPGTEYDYLAYRIVGKKKYYGSMQSFSTASMPEYAVDLGLPSGKLWRDRNLGAEVPTERGGYYAWAETGSKSNFTEQGYKFYDSHYIIYTRYSGNGGYNTDGKERFYQYDYEDDAARRALGGKWRVPSYAEWEELQSNCYYNWEKINDVWGFMFRSKNNDGKIFLPVGGYKNGTTESVRYSNYEAQGYYWMDQVRLRHYNGDWDNLSAWVFNPRYNSGYMDKEIAYDVILRYFGAMIRPICEE